MKTEEKVQNPVSVSLLLRTIVLKYFLTLRTASPPSYTVNVDSSLHNPSRIFTFLPKSLLVLGNDRTNSNYFLSFPRTSLKQQRAFF